MTSSEWKEELLRRQAELKKFESRFGLLLAAAKKLLEMHRDMEWRARATLPEGHFKCSGFDRLTGKNCEEIAPGVSDGPPEGWAFAEYTCGHIKKNLVYCPHHLALSEPHDRCNSCQW